VKLQGFNLANNRAITSFSGSTLFSVKDPGLYLYQAGQTIEFTIGAKF
jgi:hypothetical protein